MKATITIKDIYAELHIPAALAGLGEAIKNGLRRVLTEKPVDEKAMVQALNTSGKRDHYWQQITIGSSRL